MTTPLVRDLMTTDVETAGRNDPLTEVDARFDAGNFRHLPVLDEDGDLTGILSRRDLSPTALARLLGYGETGLDRLYSTLVVKDVMTNSVETIAPGAPASEAATRMLEGKLGALVVVDGGKLAGIITESDFVRRFADG
jgi:CBS domain-containing membrane protein